MNLSERDLEQHYRGRRVLVTGGSGFIGPWVARRLAALGAQVWLAGRSREALAAAREAHQFSAVLAAGDLAVPGAFAELFRQVQPEITFHLAGYGVDPGERDENSAGALNARLVAEVAEVVAGRGKTDWEGLRLIQAGSGAEYGPVPGALSEDSPAAPVSLYGRTKLAGTQAVQEAVRERGLRGVSVRLFLVYGPGEHAGRLLPSLLAAAQSGQPLAMTAGEQLRDFTYVEDVAEGLVRIGCVAAPAPVVVNLATGVPTALREFVECAAQVLHLKRSQLQFGALPYRPEEVAQGPVDTRRLAELTGWRPACSIREGIQRTVAWEARRSGVRV